LAILKEAEKISIDVCEELYERSLEFSSKTKNLIDYLKDFEAAKKKKK
jgi:hypothetical protein